mgnify:CR=1 FL=1
MNDVGEVRGIEFYSFRKVYKNIPNMQDIENDPEHAMLPQGGKEEMMVMTATVSQLYYSASYKNFAAYCTYVKRFPRKELVSLFMAGIRKHHEELVETQEYTDIQLFSKRGY